jgi:RNA polymerase sigma-70 factor (ECF subfamily)
MHWFPALASISREPARGRPRPPFAGGDAPESDQALVGRAGRGDRDAFDELYRRNVDMVWRVLTRIVGPDPEREDLVQQIFLDAFRSIDRFRGDSRFGTYLYRVAANTAFEHLQRRARRPRAAPVEAFDALEHPAPSPERRVLGREHLRAVWSLLERIKPKKRVAFVLRMVEGLSLEEVGAVMDARPDAIAHRVRHAHEELQRLMERRGIEP